MILPDEYDIRLDKMQNKVDAAIKDSGKNNKEEFVKRLKNSIVCMVIYGAYDVVEDLPIDNLDDVAFEGTFIVTGDYDEFWDGRNLLVQTQAARRYPGQPACGRDYKSDPIIDPTWLQLTVLANECIIVTNDFHHVFFEGARIKRNPSVEHGILTLSFGS